MTKPKPKPNVPQEALDAARHVLIDQMQYHGVMLWAIDEAVRAAFAALPPDWVLTVKGEAA